MEDYIFERVTPDHYPLLKELYLDAFNIKTDVPGIQKRFDTSQLGCEHIGFIAFHKETKDAAAYYGIFPMKAIIGNNIVQIAQSGDTMTHSAHRKKGLFAELAKHTYEECRRKGIKIIIGQPNEQSYHGLVKSLKWTHLDEIIRWDLKLKIKTFPLAKTVSRLKLFQNLYLQYARLILKKNIIDTPLLFNNTISSNYARILRDAAYLDYKKSKNKFFLKIREITAWVCLSDVFWIGDIDDYGKITPATIKRIKKIAFFLGFNTISFNLNRTIPPPKTLSCFKKSSEEKSCFFYIDKELDRTNFLLTAADFDTW